MSLVKISIACSWMGESTEVCVLRQEVSLCFFAISSKGVLKEESKMMKRQAFCDFSAELGGLQGLRLLVSSLKYLLT